MLKAIQYLIFIMGSRISSEQAPYFAVYIKTVSEEANTFLEMPNIKALSVRTRFAHDLTLPSLVMREETRLEILWPLAAWCGLRVRGPQSGTLRQLTIHMGFPKRKHRLYLKAFLIAPSYTFYPPPFICAQSPSFQEGNLDKRHSQLSSSPRTFLKIHLLQRTCIPTLVLPSHGFAHQEITTTF